MTASRPDAMGDDTEIIRSTFRLITQRGAILIGVITLFDSMTFYAVGDSQWWWGCGISLACIPAYFLLDIKRTFRIFFTTLMLMLGITAWYCVHIALRWGGDINFHYKLVAIIPLIAVSGRLPIRMKWALILGCTAGMVALDHQVAMVSHTFPVSPTVSALMEGFNFGIPILAMAALVIHYFKLIAQQQALLKEHATTDPLTGLMNRRRLREVWTVAEADGRRGSFPLSIILCDVDHFKSINDIHGHEVGDEVLRRLGQLLPREVRTGDSVCRWGGEEFLLLLPHSDRVQAMAMAERIRAVVAGTPLKVGSLQLDITITLGVATLVGDEKFEAAAHRADAALYEGKRAGRNQVVAAADHYPSTASAA